MSSGNVARSPNLRWLLCVIDCSFVHFSLFTQSTNTISCEIVISPLHSAEPPLSYLDVSLRNVCICLFYSSLHQGTHGM